MLEIKEIKEKGEWNPLEIDPSCHFTQSYEYGEGHALSGKEVLRLKFFDDKKTIGYCQLISYPLKGGEKFLYAPFGPVLRNATGIELRGIKNFFIDFAKKEGAAFVRLDFSPLQKEANSFFFRVPQFAWTGSYFQPRFDWVTSLNGGSQRVLQDMKDKVRYSVHYAEKKGVTIEIYDSWSEDIFEEFMVLMKATANRNGFTLHDEKSYQNMVEVMLKGGKGFLSFAKYQNKKIAAAFVVVYGSFAHYVFGASSDEYKNVSAPYLLHIQAMRKSMELGATFYSFGSIEDEKKKIYKNWSGITTFKKKFPGKVYEHGNFYDIVNKRTIYILWLLKKAFYYFKPR